LRYGHPRHGDHAPLEYFPKQNMEMERVRAQRKCSRSGRSYFHIIACGAGFLTAWPRSLAGFSYRLSVTTWVVGWLGRRVVGSEGTAPSAPTTRRPNHPTTPLSGSPLYVYRRNGRPAGGTPCLLPSRSTSHV